MTKPLIAVLCAGVAGWLALAQTRVKPENLGVATLTAPSSYRVYIAYQNGSIMLADLGREFTLDTTGTRPVLHVSQIAPIVEKTFVLRPLTITSVFSFTTVDVPINGSVVVYRNGLMLTQPDDYGLSADSRTITLVAGQEAQSGDIVQCRYRTQ